MSITATQDIAWQIQPGSTLGKISSTRTIAWQISQHIAGMAGSTPITWAIGVDLNLSLVLSGAPTGLAGTVTVEIATADGSVYAYLPSAQNVSEVPSGTGRYLAIVPKPGIGQYLVVWRHAGQATQPETLYVVDDQIIRPPLRAATIDRGRYELRSGDTDPLIVQLVNQGFTPIDLTSVDTITARITCADGTSITRDSGVLDAITGLVIHSWVSPTETTSQGTYTAQWDITLADGTLVSVPSMGEFTFKVS